MNARDRFSSATALAKDIGATGRIVTEHELQELVRSTEVVWSEINPHNAMELFSILARSLGARNAPEFLARAVSTLQRHPNYTEEVERNSAAHCLVAAVLVSDRPDLLSPKLSQAQARYLSSYSVSNCGYNAEELATLQRHIGPYL
jgi:hypothetical protein